MKKGTDEILQPYMGLTHFSFGLYRLIYRLQLHIFFFWLAIVKKIIKKKFSHCKTHKLSRKINIYI